MTAVRGVPVDYTDVGYEALRASMLEIARQTLPEWTDHSDNDVGVLLELENARFRKRMRMPVWSRTGFVYVGRSGRGLEYRVAFFGGATLKDPS